MEINGRTIVVCDCNGTMSIDGKALAKACGAEPGLDVNTLLCRSQIGNLERALHAGLPVVVACTQEAPLFAEARAEIGVDTDLTFVNIREHAGWSDEADRALPKMAALIAEAALDIPPTGSLTLKSSGVTLIYGRDETAIEAATQIADRLDCTVLISKPGDIVPPRLAAVPIFRGTVAAAKGHLGAFEVVVNDYAPTIPSSRGKLAFEPARDGASSTCDLILDLTGNPPLFSAHEKRDGYLRADPNDPKAVQQALFEIVEMTGEFEKPSYVLYDATLCAHGRSRKTGCTRCLDVCPTGAITPNGDHVAIDGYVCAGCGSCAAVCPTGAKSPAVIKEENPAHCIRCGKAFGVRGAIEKVIEKLAGKHWMFQDGVQAERIRMCEDCRLVIQYERGQDPFTGPPRPVPRTTEDYLREREAQAAREALKPPPPGSASKLN